MSQNLNRITIDPNICNGKPTIRGLRITVQTVLELMASGDSKEEILKQYPMLEELDLNASLEFASKMLDRNFTIKAVA